MALTNVETEIVRHFIYASLKKNPKGYKQKKYRIEDFSDISLIGLVQGVTELLNELHLAEKQGNDMSIDKFHIIEFQYVRHLFINELQLRGIWNDDYLKIGRPYIQFSLHSDNRMRGFAG